MAERSKGARTAAHRAGQVLAERATMYAEVEIELVELDEPCAEELIATAVRMSDTPDFRVPEWLVTALNSRLAAASTNNMVAVTKAIARGFAHGYAARGDDREPARPLGGPDEDRRRKG